MSGERRLPEPDVLRTLLLSGHGPAAIGRLYGVTTQAADAQVRRAGLDHLLPRTQSLGMLPWSPVKVEHEQDYLVRMLRLHSRSQGVGAPLVNSDLEAKAEAGTLTPEEAKKRTALARLRAMLDRFEARMDEAKAVVTYDYETGFDVVPAEPGDRHYVRWPADVPDQRNQLLARARAS